MRICLIIVALGAASLIPVAGAAGGPPTFTALGDLPGAPFGSRAYAVSADGSVVVGVGTEGEPLMDEEAFLWTKALGMVNLEAHLRALGATGLNGWTLRAANGISLDGRFIVGEGTRSTGEWEAWLVDLGGTCYPDCSGDGTLNLADFGCFQTRFALGGLYADCNADQVLSLADFGCFQTVFALGCP